MPKLKQNPLLSAIDADYKQAQKDLWNYHKDQIRQYIDREATATTCDNVVLDMAFDGEYDDLCYFAGYFRGLNSARDIIAEYLEKQK